MYVIELLRARRDELKAEGRGIAETAQGEGRALSRDEETRVTELLSTLKQLDERIEQLEAAEQHAENSEKEFLRLTGGRRGLRGSLSAEDTEVEAAFRSAIVSRNPAPIDIAPTRRGYSWPGLEKRDLLKTTATQAVPVSVFDRIVEHMVEGSAVLRAGATVINTDSGENLQVPKSTAFSSAAITGEGAQISESDPTLAVTTLGAFKYAAYFEVSSELLADGSPDLLGFLPVRRVRRWRRRTGRI